MSKHIIKYDWDDGVKLKKHEVITWCGAKPCNWMFQDAQHAALSLEQGAYLEPCDRCLKAIISTLQKSVNEIKPLEYDGTNKPVTAMDLILKKQKIFEENKHEKSDHL